MDPYIKHIIHDAITAHISFLAYQNNITAAVITTILTVINNIGHCRSQTIIGLISTNPILVKYSVEIMSIKLPI